MRVKQPSRRAGLTLTELLVVVVIVSLLATIAVPVYTNQAAKARLALTLTEEKEIADAEQHERSTSAITCAFTPSTTVSPATRFPNCSTDSKLGGVYDNGFLHSMDNRQIYHRSNRNLPDDRHRPAADQRRGPLRPVDQERDQFRLGRARSLNWHRDVNFNDWPDDPWGNDYCSSRSAARSTRRPKQQPFRVLPRDDRGDRDARGPNTTSAPPTPRAAPRPSSAVSTRDASSTGRPSCRWAQRPARQRHQRHRRRLRPGRRHFLHVWRLEGRADLSVNRRQDHPIRSGSTRVAAR